MRLVSVAVALGALVLAAACVPADADFVKRYPADTPLGELQESGEMTIAVQSDWPPFGSTPENDAVRGFLTELARFIAREMGVRARIVAGGSADEVFNAVADNIADLGLARIQLVEDLVRNYPVTDPYFIAHQRLLVAEESGLESVDDLSGMSVCEVPEGATSISIAELNPDARVVQRSDVHDCVRALRGGKVDAVSAQDARLFYALDDPSLALVGENLTTVGYGAVASPEVTGLSAYFDGELAEAKNDGDWLRWHAEHIEPLTGEEGTPPNLSMEEAAALYPVQ